VFWLKKTTTTLPAFPIRPTAWDPGDTGAQAVERQASREELEIRYKSLLSELRQIRSEDPEAT
jgi:hypothetical protein